MSFDSSLAKNSSDLAQDDNPIIPFRRLRGFFCAETAHAANE